MSSQIIRPVMDAGCPEFIPDGDAIHLIHPATGLSYRFSSTARAIWDVVQAPTTAAAVLQHVLDTFDAPPDEAARAVDATLDQLAEMGLVELGAPHPADALRRRYLALLERALMNFLYPEHELRLALLEQPVAGDAPHTRVDRERKLRDIRASAPADFDALVRAKADGRIFRGRPWRFSHTMVGLRRLQHLHWCARHVFSEHIPGDFLEAGVCQGGAAIYMRALQVAYGEPHRLLWAADSFEGLPVPDHVNDEGHDFSEGREPWLAATLESVRENFRRYDLLSDAVRFLPGWFRDSLPAAPIEQLAILRLDADLYTSTLEALEPLYDKLAPGGFVIVDDYHAFVPCRMAITEFRDAHGIDAPLHRIDWSAVYWRRPR